jgi:MoxR-like ATPase
MESIANASQHPNSHAVLRQTAEHRYAAELSALSAVDAGPKPPGWRLSPRAVRTFICGGSTSAHQGRHITRKFYGDDALVERAIVTLAGSRGLMLVGEPGTAKSMLSELLAAAVSGVSTNLIQGNAGTTEEQIAYGFNYALLLAEGPSEKALVPGPLHIGMRNGQIVRFEEITRCPLEVQDMLVSVLSEKLLVVGELEGAARLVHGRPGFNVIATANLRDRGVHEMSAALKRRFNFETVAPIAERKLEVELVRREAEAQLEESGVPMELAEDVVSVLITAFHDLRTGVTAEGVQVERPSTIMSTAEAVSVCLSAGIDAHYYGDGKVTPERLGRHLSGVVFKDQRDDLDKLRHYFHTVVKRRAEEGQEQPLWQDFLRARSQWSR